MGSAAVRPMVRDDLPEVASVCNAAFAALRGDSADAAPMFPALLFETRFAADPAGCLVAVDPTSGQVSAALFSVARGTLGWFGPLAVHPEAQRRGLGEELVATYLDTSHQRGVRLMGLEALPASPFHVQFYGKMAFRPSWTGINFRRSLIDAATSMPPDIDIDGILIPDLDFVYEGLHVSAEVAATMRCGAGHVLTTDGGVAILHVESTFQPPDAGFVPFCAAENWDAFSRLVATAEHLSHENGRTSLLMRTSGSSITTLDGLTDLGYRAGAVMVRMKAGADPEYDRKPVFYVDNWL